ncbi:hypothetical protein CRUP_013145 [Coryphaenoides rupestris]|nr:hypothetical protein CRUP_013145 [Coryphaenoides rupestris]
MTTREFLSMSIMSAVTRKRKKGPSLRPAGVGGSSTDDESSTNRSRPVTTPPRSSGKTGGTTTTTTPVRDVSLRGKREVVKRQRTAPARVERRWREARGRRATGEARGSCRSLVPPRYLAKPLPVIPSWLPPGRLRQNPGLQARLEPECHPLVSVRYRKARGGRERAVSMNLDLEMRREVRDWRGEKVEVIRVTEGVPRVFGAPQGSIVGPAAIQQRPPRTDQLRAMATEGKTLSPPPPSSSLGFMDPDTTTVVLRKSAMDSRDKRRAFRRHTIVV